MPNFYHKLLLKLSSPKPVLTMSKRAQYGLLFNRNTTALGNTHSYITTIGAEIGYNSALGFINRLNEFECTSLIDDLKRCIKVQGNVDEGFFSDSVEDMSILYKYPDIIIDDWYTVSMQDLKELLQEWLAFAFRS